MTADEGRACGCPRMKMKNLFRLRWRCRVNRRERAGVNGEKKSSTINNRDTPPLMYAISTFDLTPVYILCFSCVFIEIFYQTRAERRTGERRHGKNDRYKCACAVCGHRKGVNGGTANVGWHIAHQKMRPPVLGGQPYTLPLVRYFIIEFQKHLL